MKGNIFERFDALDALKNQNLKDLKDLADEGAAKYGEAQKEVERAANTLEKNPEDKKLQRAYALALETAQVFKSGVAYCNSRIAQGNDIEA